MYKTFASVLVFAVFTYFAGCGEKKVEKPEDKDNEKISSIIKKDSVTGKEKLQLKYLVNKGDKFS